jgi:D-glycero-D-manno-heptose 1,7-bisphosphate phosphatase
MGVCPLKSAPRRAVFLDRDGVLNRPMVRNGKPFPPDTLEQFEIVAGAGEALLELRSLGFWLCVVTNQPDVARGSQQRSVVEAMHGVLRNVLQLEDFYICYHDDKDGCGCRKPKPGLLLAAAAEHGVSLTDSYMIGDRWRDIDCGNSAGCTTIFIDAGYNECLQTSPHFRAPDLPTAVRLISTKEKLSL